MVEQVKNERSMLILTVRQREAELDSEINELKQDVRGKDQDLIELRMEFEQVANDNS